jgi:hypothetical protein
MALPATALAVRLLDLAASWAVVCTARYFIAKRCALRAAPNRRFVELTNRLAHCGPLCDCVAGQGSFLPLWVAEL